MKRLALLSLAGGMLISCGGDDAGPPEPPPPPPLPPASASITTPLVPPPVFIPAEVTIRAGGTVTFKNADASPAVHDVRSATNAWAMTTLQPGESFTVTLTTPGRYLFECSLHLGMTGAITVE